MSRDEILSAAQQCVMQDRNATHGEPEDNFRTIGEYWSTYLQSQGFSVELQPHDVGAMMILMKCSRLATSPSRDDHWIDIAGYAACGGQCATKKAS
jgi:hypothetical protein